MSGQGDDPVVWPEVLPTAQSKLKDAAGEWGKTIAAITTAAGIFATVGTEAKFSDLTDAAQQTVLDNMRLAFVCGVAAIVLAFLAQFDDGTGYRLGSLRIKPRALLYTSIGAAIIGAYFIAQLWGTALTGVEEEPAEAAAYIVTFGNDQPATCGELVFDAEGNLTVNDAPLVQVVSLVRAEDGCPEPAAVSAAPGLEGV